jgi:hypothetical protein
MARADLDHPAGLRQLLISAGVPADADDEELLAAARSAKHKLHITVLSARCSAGQPLSPEQRAELAAYRHPLKQYRAAWSIVAGAAPRAQVGKGWTIGDHYPPGLLRSAGDLDMVCSPDELCVYDLSILTGRLDHAALETLDDALTATMLWPQLRELSGPLARSGLAAGLALAGVG